MSAFCFLAMVLAVACTCRALTFSLAFQPFESMEAYPQSFFTTEQITSYATLLCQQGVRIYLGPTSPSLFCPDGSSGSEVGCAYAGNFSASEYLAAASTLPNEAQQLGCARGAWEGGIDCIADDCLPTSHTAKRVDESNKQLKIECNKSHSYNSNLDRGVDQVRGCKSEQDDSSDSDMSEELLDLDDEESSYCKNELAQSHKSTTKLASHEDLKTLRLPAIEAQSAVPPSNEVWHSRRSKSDVIASKQSAHKMKMRTKHAKKSLVITYITNITEERISRPKLKFMAAPGVKDKKKRQTTLMSMFGKK